MKSRWDPQLRSDQQSGGADCDPLTNNNGTFIAPCGAVANSLFNGTTILILIILIILIIFIIQIQPSRVSEKNEIGGVANYFDYSHYSYYSF